MHLFYAYKNMPNLKAMLLLRAEQSLSRTELLERLGYAVIAVENQKRTVRVRANVSLLVSKVDIKELHQGLELRLHG